MKMIKILGLTLAAAGMMTITAQAGPITGGISLAGGYTVDTGDLNTADAFTSFTDVIVTSRSGSYIAAGITAGTAVTMFAFDFDPFSGPVVPLWATTAGPSALFRLDTLTLVDQPGDNTLELRGFGTLFLTGYDPTPGSWLFTANQLGNPLTFSFSSSNGAQVPDGGGTLILLGSAIVGLFGFARKSLRIA